MVVSGFVGAIHKIVAIVVVVVAAYVFVAAAVLVEHMAQLVPVHLVDNNSRTQPGSEVDNQHMPECRTVQVVDTGRVCVAVSRNARRTCRGLVGMDTQGEQTRLGFVEYQRMGSKS